MRSHVCQAGDEWLPPGDPRHRTNSHNITASDDKTLAGGERRGNGLGKVSGNLCYEKGAKRSKSAERSETEELLAAFERQEVPEARNRENHEKHLKDEFGKCS